MKTTAAPLAPLSLVVAGVLLGSLGTAQVCPEERALLATDGAAGDLFGGAVAVDGNFVLVGARDADDNGANSGSAYLFDHTTGVQLLELLPNDGAAGDRFGTAVALENDRAVVGALQGNSGAGAVYLFDAGTGVQIAKLSGTPLANNDFFGSSVDIDGGVVVVGAYGENQALTDDGAAYLFDATTGAFLRKLGASDAESFDFFGRSVAIDGNLVLVGASHEDEDGDRSGSAYVFDVTTGAELRKLTPSDGAPFRFFGISCDLEGTTGVVGATFANLGASGAVYVIDVSTGTQLQKLAPADFQPSDEFGALSGALSISGGTILGGTRDHGSQGVNSGAAYLFDAATGEELVKLLPTTGASGDEFGIAVSIDGTTAVAGAWGTTNGTAYVFPGESSRWRDLGNALAGVSGAPVLRGCGHVALGGRVDLALSNAAPSAPLFLVIGEANVSFPLFGGILVPSPDEVLGFATDPTGAFTHTIAPIPVSILPGLTRIAQYWILDAAAPQGLAVSNASRVTSL